VILYTLIQIVAMGTLPGLATDATPLASASRLFLGTTGGVILTLGAILSSMGTMSAHMLVGPRMLYALAQGKQLPIALMRVHPRYRTPYISVILFGLVAWAFALYGSFGQLAALSAIARLPYYITTCLAVPVLRRRMQQSQRKLTLPGGPVIPTLGIAVSLWLLTGSSGIQAAIGGTTLLIGAVVYWSYRRFRASG
jgi:APA family basic amino acid/polyamine antiporter